MIVRREAARAAQRARARAATPSVGAAAGAAGYGAMAGGGGGAGGGEIVGTSRGAGAAVSPSRNWRAPCSAALLLLSVQCWSKVAANDWTRPVGSKRDSVTSKAPATPPLHALSQSVRRPAWSAVALPVVP